ncbi:MAG: maleylpyruvate isomerase family mycothiol-dependent enzyme [Nitrospinota bacterium]
MADTSWSISVPWLARENARLASLFRTFGGPAWGRPSYCPGWTAAHVVSHITSGANFYRASIESGRKGIVGPLFGAKDVPGFRKIRAREMEELLALPGAERVDRFEEAVGALQRTLEGLQPHELDMNGWHPRCPTPIRNFPDQRLYELVLHEWDIQNEPERPLVSGALGAVLEILKDRIPFLWNNTGHAQVEGVFRFETADPGAAWEMEIRGGKAERLPEGKRGRDALLAATASDMVLMVCGRAPIPAKIASGQLRIAGDRAKADVLIGSVFLPY